jgi:hypothetical protein
VLHCNESERGTGEKNVLEVVNKRQRWAREEVYSTFATGYERQLPLSSQIYDIVDIGAYEKISYFKRQNVHEFSKNSDARGQVKTLR